MGSEIPAFVFHVGRLELVQEMRRYSKDGKPVVYDLEEVMENRTIAKKNR